MAIISLSGLIGSGKNAVAEYLVQNHGFVQDSFAKSLKDAVAEIFGWNREMLEGNTAAARAERDIVDQWWAKRLDIPHLTPRWVLQNFGTNVCREHFHDDIWLASLENRLRNRQSENIVISDSRFFNELNMLEGLGGVTVRVERGLLPDWWSTATTVHSDSKSLLAMIESGIHRSEWDWAGFDFRVQISNNGTLPQLYQKVEQDILKNLE